MIKNLICIQCPRGCHLEVDTETLKVTGNSCPRGETYGKAEVTNPIRTISSTVKVEGSDISRCSVRTASPVPKRQMFEIMDEINKVTLTAPVEVGQVVIHDVCHTGVDVIATKRLEKIV